MKANCWYGKHDVRVEEVPDPKILNPRDAIVQDHLAPRSAAPTCTCTTASFPTMENGDILGHEFMGEVVELGSGGEEPEGRRSRRRPVPDRLRQLLLLPEGRVFAVRELEPERLDGGEAVGPLAGRHLRLFASCSAAMPAARRSTRACPSPTSDRSRSPDGLTDEQVLFLSDIFPTGYMAAENCNIQPGDTVAVWGCGPVGQFAIKSAFMLGAGA